MSGGPAPDPARRPGGEGGVVIVLSSYNGAAFVAEQLESICRQTYPRWTLLVRDDGSTDDTVRMVESLAASEPRIALIRDGLGNLGPAQSFGALLQVALTRGAEYVACADQDDVWEADKLDVQLEAMRSREATVGRTRPVLVHTDLAVVDESLRLLHPSFLAYQGLDGPREAALERLLTQNFVTGCTTLVNRSLLKAALPLPDVVMHDWWLALCAASMGELVYCPRATVRYRQHERNAAGSRWWVQVGLDAALHPLAWWRRSSAAFAATVTQAGALAARMEREAGPAPPDRGKARGIVRAYAEAFTGRRRALERLRIVRGQGVRPRTSLPFPFFFYARVALWPGRVGVRREADR